MANTRKHTTKKRKTRSSRTTSNARAKTGTSNRERLQTVLGTRVFTIILLFGIIVVGVSLTKSLIRKVEVQQQISELELEIADLERQNGELDDLMSYFSSSGFQDKEARKKLGLKEEGEQVVFIQQDRTAFDVAPEIQAEIEPELTNIQKWKVYFFN